MPRNANRYIRKLLITLIGYYSELPRSVFPVPRNANRYEKTSNHVNWVLYRITPICSARSPCLAMLTAIQKTSNHVNWVLYRITPICSARSPCLATLCYIKRLLIPLIGYYSELPRSPVPRKLTAMRKLLITLIGYYSQLPRLVRGPRLNDAMRKPNHVNWVLYRITPICSARSPCLAIAKRYEKLLITLIGYYSQLPRSVVRGPRASQPCAISKDF